MIRIEGEYFDGQRAKPWPSVLVGENSYHLEIDGHPARPLVLSDVEISDRLGDLPRQLRFADGASFTTRDNDEIDRLLQARGLKSSNRFLHGLESRWRYTLAGLLLVGLLSWLTVAYGIPAASRLIAQQLPARIYDLASAQTLELLRAQWLEQSRLPAQRRRQLDAQFDAMTSAIEWPSGFRLYFHDSAMANAFALPDGSIVVTDDLILLAETDAEILAVLAHEAGHVVLRHGMRRLVQNAMFAFIGIMVTGDTSGMSAIALGLPAILLELGYSRDFELEADRFSVEVMRASGADPDALARILGRLDPETRRRANETDVLDYWSTHPATAERIERIRELAGGSVD